MLDIDSFLEEEPIAMRRLTTNGNATICHIFSWVRSRYVSLCAVETGFYDCSIEAAQIETCLNSEITLLI